VVGVWTGQLFVLAFPWVTCRLLDYRRLGGGAVESEQELETFLGINLEVFRAYKKSKSVLKLLFWSPFNLVLDLGGTFRVSFPEGDYVNPLWIGSLEAVSRKLRLSFLRRELGLS
jgi:hypothetical protein